MYRNKPEMKELKTPALQYICYVYCRCRLVAFCSFISVLFVYFFMSIPTGSEVLQKLSPALNPFLMSTKLLFIVWAYYNAFGTVVISLLPINEPYRIDQGNRHREPTMFRGEPTMFRGLVQSQSNKN